MRERDKGQLLYCHGGAAQIRTTLLKLLRYPGLCIAP